MTADTDEGVEGRERTTDEVVRETRLNFLRQRADHHRKMAGMMKQPFKGDHEELAGAFDEAARRLRNRESESELQQHGHGGPMDRGGFDSLTPSQLAVRFEAHEHRDHTCPLCDAVLRRPRTALTQDREDEDVQ